MTSRSPGMLGQIAQLLDQLGIAAAVYDAQNRAVLWNGSFLRFFPEHADAIHVGEPYEANLRRFYLSRLDPSELPCMDRYIADGVARHERQSWPFEFCHRGVWLRVGSLTLPGVGRMRVWTRIAAPDAGETLALGMAAAGKGPAIGSAEHIADGLMARDEHGRIVLVNRRFVAMYGLESEADADGATFAGLIARLWSGLPGEAEAMLALADNSRFCGSPFELPLPGDRWVRISEHRAPDGSMVSTHVDITDLHRLQRATAAAQRRAEALAASLREQVEERRRAEAQLKASEEKMRRMLDSMPTPLICSRLGRDAEVLFVNRQFVQSFGYTPEDVPNLAAWARRAHPDEADRQDLAVPWEMAVQQSMAELGRAAAVEARVRCNNGTILDVLVSAEVLEDMVLVSLVDITARKHAEERQILLAREVDHRAKNALAVVQAALRLTPKDDTASYARSVEGRVTALARAHNLLVKDQWRGADLRSLLAGELAPFIARADAEASPQAADDGPRARLEGPEVMLPLETVQPLAMVAHELATNAVKYGALSAAGGLVSITWSVLPARQERLRLRWAESGGPGLPGVPERRGFGSRIIETTIEKQLGGRVERRWTGQGLECEMELPLIRRTAPGNGLSPAASAHRP